MKVAFIGLGIMGSRMAGHLLENNVALTVYNRTPEAGLPLKEKGAKVVGSVAEAVKEADLVFSMLSTPEVVSDMFWGEGKALQFMKKGACWVDSTTVNPSFSMEAKVKADEAGIRFLDAPVSGSKPQAEKAELLFLAGTDEQNGSFLEPYFQMMGKKTFYMGKIGQGAAFKMIINMMLAQSVVVFSEAVLLGEKLGLSREFLLQTLPDLVVTPPYIKGKINAFSTGEYELQFPLEWMLKDLHLAAISAYEKEQPLFMANLAKEIFAKAKQAGMGREDLAVVFKYLDSQTK
ncbi:MAG: NAD(P)-dependent oxidoreductase [Bacteroidales bacterium]|nr:NAD(P)-dependent oxidoreductase [Bacteroidales bacterium]